MMVAANNTGVPTAVPHDLRSCSAVYIGLFFKWRKKSNLDENFVLQWLPNLSNHTLPEEFLKWRWSKNLEI